MISTRFGRTTRSSAIQSGDGDVEHVRVKRVEADEKARVAEFLALAGIADIVQLIVENTCLRERHAIAQSNESLRRAA